MKLRLLSAADMVKALPMAEAIEGMKGAYAQLSTGQARMPLRSRIDIPAMGSSLVMPAYLEQNGALAVKVVSVFPQNTEIGLPIIHALVMVLDSVTGRPQALLEGGALTAIRTGAASGAATDLLARPDAASVLIVGSGVQARTQLEAVCTVRDIRDVRIVSLDHQQAEEFVIELAGRGPIPTAIAVAEDVDMAVAEADIICTATTSSTPVFDGRLIKPGTHINGVGSFTPEMQEVDLVTVQRSLVVVDSRTAVLAEAGDLIIPLENGDIKEDHIFAELGEIVSGHLPGRERQDQITFFKSVGVAAQDAAAASITVKNALDRDLGTTMSL
jgi:ornithine cyclodeaminase